MLSVYFSLFFCVKSVIKKLQEKIHLTWLDTVNINKNTMSLNVSFKKKDKADINVFNLYI